MFDTEKCVRCRQRYKFEELKPSPGGFGICADCSTKIDAANEETRRCPVDGQKMVKRMVGNAVLLDKCLTCGGVWFDGDELRIVNELIKEETVARGLLASFNFWT